MAKPERRDPAKEKFWRRLMQRWLRSGWCVREFCFEYDLSEASFYSWRREILRRDREALTAVPGTRTSSSTTTSLPSPAADSMLPVFVKVTLDDACDVEPGHAMPAMPISAMPMPSAIEVVIGERRRLFVRPGFDANSFRQLLRLLEEPSC